MKNDAGLAHGVYYVPRDGSAVYHLDVPSGGHDRLATDAGEAAVAGALLGLAVRLLGRAQHQRHTGGAAKDSEVT